MAQWARTSARLIRSGQMFGGRGVSVGVLARDAGLTNRLWCGHELTQGSGLRRRRDGHREAAMAMMAGEGLLVGMITVAEERCDFRLAGWIGHVEVVQAMQRAQQEIADRDKHSQQPARIAQAEGSFWLVDRGHDVTLVAIRLA